MAAFALFALIGALLGSVRAEVTQQFLGVADSYTTTSVGIGDPPQFFDLGIFLHDDKLVLLDQVTANGDLDYQYDYVKNLFSPPSSGTAQLTGQLCRQRAGKEQSFGQFADDLITLADQQYEQDHRFCLLNTTRKAKSTSDDELKWLMDKPVDGFIGLAPGGENVLEKILPAGDRRFTMVLVNGSKEVDQEGVLTIGGKDEENCEEFDDFPADDADSWRLWTNDISFNGKVDNSDWYSIRFDPSSNRLRVPSNVYDWINSYFGGSSSPQCSYYPNPPLINMTIFALDFSFPLKDYFQPQSPSSSYCKVMVDAASATDDDKIVLGRYFLYHYCLHLDYDQCSVGLARAKGNLYNRSKL